MKAKVVLVRDANVVDVDWKVNAEIIQRMLDDAVKELGWAEGILI
jgi:hypothetical protein